MRAGTVAESGRPRALRLQCSETLREDGFVGSVAGVFAESDRGRVQGSQERIQGRGIRRGAQRSSLHGTNGCQNTRLAGVEFGSMPASALRLRTYNKGVCVRPGSYWFN